MRTSLKYVVHKEEEYNFNKDKMINRIIGRAFEFTVVGCKSEEEHERIVNDFYNFLNQHDVESNGFCEYNTLQEAIKYGDEKSFSYLDIPIEDVDDKEYIKNLYKEWKEKHR